MKTTDHFKRTIQAYLEEAATKDELFAVTYAKSEKNIDDCITYILNQVQTSGCNGFTDYEIYSLAVHYYDEDNIEVGKKMNCQVIVNHTVELTDEEKAEARKDAIKRLEDEAYQAMKRKQEKAKVKQPEQNQQLSLF